MKAREKSNEGLRAGSISTNRQLALNKIEFDETPAIFKAPFPNKTHVVQS
jgi:hypothetical protein